MIDTGGGGGGGGGGEGGGGGGGFEGLFSFAFFLLWLLLFYSEKKGVGAAPTLDPPLEQLRDKRTKNAL